MFTKCILTFLVAMVPVVELRGAIPIGMGMGLTLWQAFILSFIGNLVPVPFIILFVRKIFAWLRQKWPKLDSFVSKLENKALSKEDLVKKYEAWALFIFVAIPLPGTGAWTGALIAAMFNMRMKKAFPAIALGVLAAGIIISAVSYGAWHVFA
mgnify:CR=1 FL=1